MNQAYTDGPTSEAWEANDAGNVVYVERRGCEERMQGVYTPPYEPAFPCDTPNQAYDLAARLNRLDTVTADYAALEAAYTNLTAACQARIEQRDRLEAALRRLADMLGDMDGSAMSDALIAAAQAAREVLE